MEEIKTIGIVVGTEDYKESDKLIRILTPDKGVLRAIVKGVKKEKAKLKYSAMPFSFCEYELVKRNAYFVVKTASSEGNLFEVTYSPEKYIASSVMLEGASEASGSDNANVFILLLTALKEVIYTDKNPYLIALKLLYDLLRSGGYVAKTDREKEFFDNIDSPDQSTLKNASRLLKRYVNIFENKLVCKIKSADLI